VGHANVQLHMLSSYIYFGVESRMNYILLIVLVEVLGDHMIFVSICINDLSVWSFLRYKSYLNDQGFYE
jgi:hypothetical protein